MSEWEDLTLIIYVVGVMAGIMNGYATLILSSIIVAIPCALLSLYLKP